ncbi:MAG: SCO family protein [Thermotogae bacterium]|nr:SCO family protein [Thermotogota bacterium]
MRKILIPITVVAFFVSCEKGLNYAKRFPYDKGYVLVNQNGDTVRLSDFRGKVVVAGYIYTHCPDICPFITNNMKKIQRLVNADPALKDTVIFLSITFDPRRDSPEVLREYARLYRVDTSNWVFLTGERRVIDSLMKDLGIVVEVGPMSLDVRVDTLEDGRVVADTVYRYEILHTDRIHVVTPDGRIFSYFKGSEADPNEVMKTIKEAIK